MQEDVAIIFGQTAANFRQRRLWVRKISILPLNFRKIWGFRPKMQHFWTKIFRQEQKFSGNFRTVQNLGKGAIDATNSRHLYIVKMFYTSHLLGTREHVPLNVLTGDTNDLTVPLELLIAAPFFESEKSFSIPRMH